MILILAFFLTTLMNPSALLSSSLHHEKQSTPIGDQELMQVLQEAHVQVFGRRASRARLAMAWGQIALENGRGKAVFNHNLGNIGPFRGRPYYKLGPSRFRSFGGFPEAARVYWELLRDRCSAAMHSFDAMDAEYTARMLRRCGYHGADVEAYARGLNSLMRSGHKLLRLEDGPVRARSSIVGR